MPDVMLQAFHWYSPGGGDLWRDVGTRAAEFADAGFTSIWLPPATKGHVGGYDVGYGVYDPYDLGEFDQKGTVPTKYGTRAQYLDAIAQLQAHGLAVFADVVWNHRLGADASEIVSATPYSATDRHHAVGPTRQVQAWTRFEYSGRAGRYDPHRLDARHFTAVDFDGWDPDRHDVVYLFDGKRFDDAVDAEFGNYHFLMGADLDHSNPEVRAQTLDWVRWYLDTTGVDGLRLDAVKHIPTWVLPIYLDAAREHVGRGLPVVAEYWSRHLAALEHFLGATGERMSLFDVPLHYTFSLAGRSGNEFDLRTVFDGSLTGSRPEHSVTFVDNHDSQPLQALESWVEDWFKPLAYALILLRRAGTPCVFLPDYDGAEYTEGRWEQPPEHVTLRSWRGFIDTCLALRTDLGVDAAQVDLFDHPNVVGWVRRSRGLVVVVLMSNGGPGITWIATGAPGAEFRDATANVTEPVCTDSSGAGQFTCPAAGVSIWVARPA